MERARLLEQQTTQLKEATRDADFEASLEAALREALSPATDQEAE
jgi:hypothetical protein